MRVLLPVVLGLALQPALLDAQAANAFVAGRPALATDSVPRTIEQAEREGSHYTRAEANNPLRPVDASARGSSERKCAEVPFVAGGDTSAVREYVTGASSTAMRSGDFVVGYLPVYNFLWRQGYGKLLWVPSTVASAPGVMVRAARLDSSVVARVFGPFPMAGDGSGTQFYPSGVWLPTAGRWMLIATAGANWGCFVLTVKA